MKASNFLVLIGILFTFNSAFGKTVSYQDSRECSEDQLQLEKEWNFYQISESESVSGKTSVGPNCVLQAMNKFEGWAKSKAVYAQCASDVSDPVRIRKPLCKTKNLVENITRLYNQFTQCAGVNPKFFFMAISSESGFFPNAFAPGQDVGIGQLTPTAIHDVNNNWDRLTAEIKASEAPTCIQLKTWMEDLRVPNDAADKSCQFIASPKNPARNLMYALLLFQQNRNYYQDLFSQTVFKQQVSALNKKSLSDLEKRQLIDHLSLLTYNMGFVRLSGLLLTFMEKSLGPFQQMGSQAEALRAEIKIVQQQIYELNRDRKVHQTSEYTEKVAKLKRDYQNLFHQMRKPLLTVTQLDPLNVESGAFGDELRKTKQSHYVDLLLQRAKSFGAMTDQESCVSKDAI